MSRLHMHKSALKPLVQINVYGSFDFGEVGSVNFSRNTGWHEQPSLVRADILGDIISRLEVIHEKLAMSAYHDSKSR